MNNNDDKSLKQILCVVVPCYNEEEVVGTFYDALSNTLQQMDNIRYNIIFIDDGSEDSTLARLEAIAERDERVDVYSLSRNYGHQIALSAGLDHAAGDAVVMMDCDMQHPPSLIRVMVNLWMQGYDVVSAIRERTAGASALKKWTGGIFYWLINHLGDTNIVSGVADFCLLSREAYQALRAMPERHRFLRGMISWIGFKRAFVSFQAPARAAGKSKYTVTKMLKLALDAVFSFSATPIKLATRVGLLVVMFATCYFLYVFFRWAFVGDLVAGWGSMICTILIVGGAQLVFIGLIGEYVIRLYEEARGGPCIFLTDNGLREMRFEGKLDRARHPDRRAAHGYYLSRWVARQMVRTNSSGTPSRNDRTPTSEEYCYERLGDRFATALSKFDTSRRVEILIDRFLTDEMVRGREIADIGCGLGFFSQRLAERGAKVLACDIAPSLVKATCERAGCSGVVADVLELSNELGANRFDGVVSSECIEHTPDPPEAIRQMVRVVKPGGFLSISTPNVIWWPIVRMATALQLRPFAGHENFSSWRLLRRVLIQSGASVERQFGLHLFPFQIPLRGLSRWCDDHLQTLRGLMINICILSKKHVAQGSSGISLVQDSGHEGLATF